MTSLTAQTADPGILFVVLTGLGIVFLGIISIIIICRLMLLIASAAGRKAGKPAVNKELPAEEFKPSGELAAVIGAAVAEEIGCDAKNIKIVSIKRV